MADAETWTVRLVLAWATDDLRKRGIPSPRLDVELMLGRVLSVSRVQLVVDADRPLSKNELAAYRELHKRRRAQEPLAYMVGMREFFGRSFRVDRRVLIPRPDTEVLVEVALERTASRALSARVLDLCTGSGCVAVTLACERPTTQVIASDISPEALAVARENALRLGAVRLGCVLSDGLAAFSGRRGCLDLITANPPYIRDDEVPLLTADIRDYEPHIALLGGGDGLAVTERIVSEAPSHLAAGGVLALEIGSDQGEAVSRLFERAGFEAIRTNRDYGGHARVVSGIRSSAVSSR